MILRTSHAAFLAAVLAAALGAATAAQAFTFEDQGSVTNSDGTRSAITDPDTSRFGSGAGSTTTQPGAQPNRSGIYFGPSQRSFNQRYNADHMFEPLGRPGDTR